MAQFDVHRNPGQHREANPYVVVVPVVKKSSLGSKMQRTRLNPTFTVKGVAVVLHPSLRLSTERPQSPGFRS